MRGHSPNPITAFNGLWKNGNAVECPADHFTDGENFRFIGSRGCGSRFGIGPFQDVLAPLGKLLRIYNYVTQDKNTLLILKDNAGTGEIYHVVDNITVLGPILSIAGMTDFALVPYAGRAYISPFTSFGTAPNIIEKGISGEFLYVYLGDGTNARKAAGAGPGTGGNITVANNGTPGSDAGDHLFGVCFEYDTGYLSPPGYYELFASNGNEFDFSGVPLGGTGVIARRIVMTKVITDYNGDVEGYQYFFIPLGRIPDNTSTTLSNVPCFDADLLEDASHLIDNYTEIPAGAVLGLYNERLCLATTFDDISLILVSTAGEPEAISQIDGLIVVQLDGNPITQLAELRDVLYVMKRNRTVSYVDNGDAPSSWPPIPIDSGLGCPVHGIATVVDQGQQSIDYLIVATYRGIALFNGKYGEFELSWKIQDLWGDLDRSEFRKIQILNDTVGKLIWCAIPDGRLLLGDYNNGLTYKSMRWTVYKFDIEATTIGLVNVNTLIIGSRIRLA